MRPRTGLVGIGECLARRGAPAYAQFIEGVLAPLLVGENPLDRRRLWNRMRSVLTGRTGGMLIEAIAGVDIALWDIAGKAAGLPVSKLLGGVGRAEIDAYASSINWTRRFAGREGSRERDRRRIQAIKVKIGQPVAAAVAARASCAGSRATRSGL